MSEIVVSGIGLVTPLGASREKTWSALLAGKSGIHKGEAGWEARINDFSPNGARSRMGDFAILAAAEALRHAGFDLDHLRGANIGCAVSQSKPLLQSWDPTLVMSSFFGWSSESVVQREFGLEGPSANLVAACATGVASIDAGVRWIQSGLCDIALVGASESSLTSLYRAGFQQMGVLTDDLPRPFDRHRNGFVMGEGAAVLVLESVSSILSRGRKPLAKLLKHTLRQSATDLLRFDLDGGAVARLIDTTVGDRPMPDYLNAHGTATVFNDLVETRGIKKAFGEKAGALAVSSTKAATGHLLGAAGAVEAAFAVLALRDQIAPPTLNFEKRDRECDLDYVPNQAWRMPIASSMSLSYGFGGQMGAVLFGRLK